MYKGVEEFVADLGVDSMPVLFGARFDEVMAEYEREGVWFLEDAFLSELQGTEHIFRIKYDFVQKAIKRVRENDFLARYSLLLYHMQRDNDHKGEIYLSKFPYAKTGEAADSEMAAFFSQLAFAHDIADHHRAHGVPEDVIADTLNDLYESSILICNSSFSRDGMHPRCFGWNQIYMNYRILRVGVLNFEMRTRFTGAVKVFCNKKGEQAVLANDRDIAPGGQMAGSAGCDEVDFRAAITETDTYYEGYAADPQRAVYTKQPVRLAKSDWRVALSAEDTVINVHIPSGASLTEANTEAAYRRAAQIWTSCYPEYTPKAFVCFSWMLDPQLRGMLKPTSNVLAFQSRYRLFATKSPGTSVGSFVFCKPLAKIEEWPQDTSLQRALKTHYLNGGYIYEQGGVLFTYLEK